MTLFMPSRWAIHYFPEVTSTQDVAKQLIAEGASGFFVVRADHQTSGRGRAGRGWSSLSGNLQATFSVPMTFDVALAANYSFVAAVALSQTVLEFVGEECCIEHKWPNDVWINGKKLAGILLEIHEPYLLMGIGLNISHAPEDAAYLNQVLSNDVGVVDFLDRFLVNLDAQMGVLECDGFLVLLDRWLDRARGLGQVITVRTLQESFSGVFDGLESDGALRVKMDNGAGMKIVHSADVFFGKDL